MTLLSVQGLSIDVMTDDGPISAVDRVDFTLNKSETIGIVGESGCGKSLTALSIARLLPVESARITAGKVIFDGHDLVAFSDEEVRKVRGRDIGFIFQEPMNSLNPVLTIGDQIIEVVREHKGLDNSSALKRAFDLLEMVAVPDAKRRLLQYPHELSGGLRQRVMIAIALACEPKLLIADEPTTALDVTVQSQVLSLLTDLQKQTGMALIVITHDLGVVAQLVDRIVVMYAGRVAETGRVEDILMRPGHPYAQGLIGCINSLKRQEARVKTIRGAVPSLKAMPPGCRFSPRCDYFQASCSVGAPGMVAIEAEHSAACIRLAGYKHVA